MNVEKCMSTKAAARYLGLSYRTLQNWRSAGKGPRYARIGGVVRYWETDLEKFAVVIEPGKRMELLHDVSFI